MFKLQKDVFLKKYSTFQIGGRTKYFALIDNLDDLKKGINFARKKNLPLFILGGGSNVLFLDEGYPGLIIKIQNLKFKIQNSIIIAEAGVSLSKLVNESQKKGLSGLEWAAGIPGTLGGAIYGNAGAFESSIGDLILNVKALDKETQEKKIFSKKDCQFDYRSSFFKKTKNYVILEAKLKLKKGEKEKIKEKIKENLNYRKNHHPLNLPSVGCIFKNIHFKDVPKKVFEKIPEILKFKKQERIPAAFLIEKAGLKGKKIGGAMISEKHSNFIVNFKDAKAEDVLILISLIKQKIREKFNILLEEEIQMVCNC